MRMLTACLTVAATLFVGCGSPEPRNPMRPSERIQYVWWRTPDRASTSGANPWLRYVKQSDEHEFDVWSNDDIQRYSRTRIVVPGRRGTGVAPIDTTTDYRHDEGWRFIFDLEEF